jgi:hypothetical protein
MPPVNTEDYWAYSFLVCRNFTSLHNRTILKRSSNQKLCGLSERSSKYFAQITVHEYVVVIYYFVIWLFKILYSKNPYPDRTVVRIFRIWTVSRMSFIWREIFALQTEKNLLCVSLNLCVIKIYR